MANLVRRDEGQNVLNGGIPARGEISDTVIESIRYRTAIAYRGRQRKTQCGAAERQTRFHRRAKDSQDKIQRADGWGRVPIPLRPLPRDATIEPRDPDLCQLE